MNLKSIVLSVVIFAFPLVGFSQVDSKINPLELTPPQENGIWLQPAQKTKAQPIWGFVNGIRVGIDPMGGPRGLLRIYTPYLKHDDLVVTNFIAFEPIVKPSVDHRGLSELEFSKLDNKPGKRFWSGDTSVAPKFPDLYYPAPGVVETIDGKETLTVYIFCEKFDNGASVYVRMRFIADDPYSFELTAYANEKSKELDKFILTATMGNKARLRELYLAEGKMKKTAEIWPDYNDVHFTDHDLTPMSDLIKDKNNGVYFIAYPDEADPSQAEYAADTHSHWKYKGDKATQYWYCKEPESDIQGSVNGRYTYWASKSPIPGGISFENFEMIQPFKEGGQTYVFGIIPQDPTQYIKSIDVD